jgi:hypothetical protein
MEGLQTKINDLREKFYFKFYGLFEKIKLSKNFEACFFNGVFDILNKKNNEIKYICSANNQGFGFFKTKENEMFEYYVFDDCSISNELKNLNKFVSTIFPIKDENGVFCFYSNKGFMRTNVKIKDIKIIKLYSEIGLDCPELLNEIKEIIIIDKSNIETTIVF